MGPQPVGRGEIGPTITRETRRREASMGPQPVGRGENARVDNSNRPRWASMGPQPVGRGEI